ncbi:MAG: cupin domain-containing protein [Coriobacteriia bacterium]|nr:cupin domain-containing protein [Coriobacteriia bacterium]
MELDMKEISNRIKSLREDSDLSAAELAEAIGVSEQDYIIHEDGAKDFSFTFLYRAAEKLGVDMIDLLTGEEPHLQSYSLVRAGEGLDIKRRESFEYLHLAPTFRHKLCEPFLVTAPYIEKEQNTPIATSQHVGQELDYIISGRLRFVYEDHTEELGAGDVLLYDSSHDHGMIAIGGEPCKFLAVVLKGNHDS